MGTVLSAQPEDDPHQLNVKMPPKRVAFPIYNLRSEEQPIRQQPPASQAEIPKASTSNATTTVSAPPVLSEPIHSRAKHWLTSLSRQTQALIVVALLLAIVGLAMASFSRYQLVSARGLLYRMDRWTGEVIMINGNEAEVVKIQN